MAEKVGTIFYDLDLDDAKFKSKTKAASGDADNFGSRIKGSAMELAALGAVATVALTQVVDYLGKAVAASVQQQNALIGLSSVARGTGNSIDATTQAAKDLAADGLMPLSDAATSLKNLLAAGYSLPQATKLMYAFKDSAAFGRQGALDFGQAIRGATEGIKNGNSILVDNAGVTKNLSVMLEEAGYSSQDLMKATTDTGVRMAIFNGILHETRFQTGDAKKLAESFGGAMAKTATQVQYAKVALGEALQPILTKIINLLAPLIEKITEFVKKNPAFVAAIAAATVIMLGLVAVLGILGAVVGAIMNLGIVGVIALSVGAAIGVLVGALVFLEMKFGFVTKAIQATKDALASAGEAIVNMFNSVMSNPAVKAVVEFIGTTFKQIWVDLQGIFKQVATSLQPVFDAFSSLFKTIGDFLSKHGKTIMTVFKTIAIVIGGILIAPLVAGFALLLGGLKLLSIVLGFINKHFEIIKKVIIGAIIVALSPLILAVGLVIGAFKLLMWSVQQIFNVFKVVFSAIWLVVSTVFNAIMAVWNAVLAPVFNAIIYLVTSLFKIWWTIWTGILEVVWTIISTIGQIIFVIVQGIWNIVWGFLQNVWNGFVNIFTAVWNFIVGVWNGIWAFLQPIINGIIAFFKERWDNLVANVKWAFELIKKYIIDPIVEMAKAVANKIGEVANAVSNGVRKAVDSAKNFFNDMISAGKNLIDGLVRGITNAKDAVVNKVKEICQGALNAVKSFFGIKSPSRVMAKMGDYLMVGLKNGIQQAGAAVVDAATSISERISNGMQSSLENVSSGAQGVVRVYRGMYGQLNAMNQASSVAINGTASAINGAAAAAGENGGAIAQAPITVIMNNEGIVARSRNEWRDIMADGIEAVNEELRARGHQQIGDGKVQGASTI